MAFRPVARVNYQVIVKVFDELVFVKVLSVKVRRQEAAEIFTMLLIKNQKLEI